MKIERFNEDHEFDVKLNDLNNKIYSIISNELSIESVSYSDGDVQISYDSVRDACDKIISYFGAESLLSAIDTKKFNI